MTENKKDDFITQPQQQGYPPVIYAYPPGFNRNDEIDLAEFFRGFFKRWKAMAGIVVCGVLVSLLIYFSLPRVYETSAIISRPVPAQLSSIDANAYTKYTPQQLFNRFYDQLRSPAKLEDFLLASEYKGKLFPENQPLDDVMLSGFLESVAIEVLEPRPEKKGELVSNPIRLKVGVKGGQEDVLADFINQYIENSANELMRVVQNEQKQVIKAELTKLDRSIASMRDMASLDKRSEVARLKDANKMAASLGIVKPTYLSDLSQQEERATTAEIVLSETQSLPLYLMGTNYLQKKIQELEERSVNADGGVDDPYIEGLAEKLAHKKSLESYSLEISNVMPYTLEKLAKIEGKKLSPNGRSVVAAGVAISVLIAFFFGLLKRLFDNSVD